MKHFTLKYSSIFDNYLHINYFSSKIKYCYFLVFTDVIIFCRVALQETHEASIIKTKSCMLFGDVIIVCCENHSKHVNRKFLNIQGVLMLKRVSNFSVAFPFRKRRKHLKQIQNFSREN